MFDSMGLFCMGITHKKIMDTVIAFLSLALFIAFIVG
jgi:hypothetical protein